MNHILTKQNTFLTKHLHINDTPKIEIKMIEQPKTNWYLQ
jgi:hypothetical protein